MSPEYGFIVKATFEGDGQAVGVQELLKNIKGVDAVELVRPVVIQLDGTPEPQETSQAPGRLSQEDFFRQLDAPGFPARITNAFLKSYIKQGLGNLEQLRYMSDTSIRRFGGIGKLSLARIREVYPFHTKPESPSL